MSRSKTAPSAATAQSALLKSLQNLGFSQYEARCYVGLLNKEPQTGYAVAKATGVPQPKVYEALRKLVSRDAAFELAGSPTRFLPTPPTALLDQLESGVSDHLSEARRAAADLVDESAPAVEVLASLNQWPAIVASAVRLAEHAERRLYVSASAAQLTDLSRPLQQALDRGVDVVVLCFGAMPFDDARVKLYRHLSTEGVIYRSHQARHLALISDSLSAVWALANDGRTWSAIETTSPLVIAALKGFIRHDIDMQQVFDDFGPELIGRYGPGLEALERYRKVPESVAPARKAGKSRQVG
jgi:HTH-type transcriptional regulator, sugar sensing transcriptional regulator